MYITNLYLAVFVHNTDTNKITGYKVSSYQLTSFKPFEYQNQSPKDENSTEEIHLLHFSKPCYVKEKRNGLNSICNLIMCFVDYLILRRCYCRHLNHEFCLLQGISHRFSAYRLGFNPRLVHLGFMVQKAGLDSNLSRRILIYSCQRLLQYYLPSRLVKWTHMGQPFQKIQIFQTPRITLLIFRFTT